MSQPPSYPGPGESQPGGSNEPTGSTPPGQSFGGQNYGGQNYGAPNAGTPGSGGGNYGAPPPPNQYGSWQGGNDPTEKNSGIAIAALVTSLTCCLSIVGVILGIIGLGKTGPGKAKGRWMAVTAIVAGSVLTLASVGIGIGVWMFAKSAITPDNAEVGQCINIDEDESENEVFLREKDCSDDHDGEVAFVGTYGETRGKVDPAEVGAATDEAGEAKAVCTQLAGGKYAELGDDYEWGVASEDVTAPGDDDKFICYVQQADGDKINTKLG